MVEFTFLENPIAKKWVVLAPRRAKRPDVATGTEPVCPFCLGREKDEPELYRVGGETGDQNWQIRVLKNKYPFAEIHELIIHSPDHHKNIGELPLSQIELLFTTYRQRYNTHKDKGQVYIFHNRGELAGESLPHPHTQLTVIPHDIKTEIPRLDPSATPTSSPIPWTLSEEQQGLVESDSVETNHFYLFCPHTSQWPDEVWIAPKKRGRAFGEITDEEIVDLAMILTRMVKIFDLRHGHEFPYNYYIYPGGDWYLRIIPRQKRLGGFEVGTGIYVNTQAPEETISFIKAHFHTPNVELIKKEYQAKYGKAV